MRIKNVNMKGFYKVVDNFKGAVEKIKNYVPTEHLKRKEISKMKDYFESSGLKIMHIGESRHAEHEPKSGRLNSSDVLIFEFENNTVHNLHVYHWNYSERRYFKIYGR